MGYILFVISLICKLSNNVLDMDWILVFYPLILSVFASAVKVAVKNYEKNKAIRATDFVPMIALWLMAGLKLSGLFNVSWWIVYLPYSLLYGLLAFVLIVFALVTISRTH